MVELKIKGFALDEEKMPIVILADGQRRVLPIWIGPFEASAIIVELEGITPPRPLTHDLLAMHFLRHGFSMDRLEIYGHSPQDCYRSRIVYHRRMRSFLMEVRPSDGLALAVRLGAPIVALEDLLVKPDSKLDGKPAPSAVRLAFLNTEHAGLLGTSVRLN